MSVEESSALSIIKSQGSSRFDSQFLAARSLGSLPPNCFASLENVWLARSSELALIQKMPQKLARIVSYFPIKKYESTVLTYCLR